MNASGPADLSTEDAKLVTLARATRARIGAAEGAAARDTDGRTYAAATVDLPSLRLSAVHAVVAMAVASGSAGLDACVLLGEASALADDDAAALGDVAGPEGVVVHLGDARGRVAATTRVTRAGE
ncbi:cytidine deaminase [Nocardioides sp.]|uniref:cytidine deaminase n=1 Tax=Nocardioides sp. TaxID=35761 RepID=UPI00351156F3